MGTESNEPVSSLEMQDGVQAANIEKAEAPVETDAEGRFSLQVPVGELPLRITPPGSREAATHERLRETVQVAPGGAFELGDVGLQPAI